ncbi:putative late blight resistance protein homolog R1A-3 [Capsicum annuum]|uniref:putative late blight resistance protein homolog R1A-3 n=1 Tax=Capsicum annuum TaxID=4072 RepID=UPI001FB05466|nr:putative late blight resistance protein homolog R1A-3 [Capsicum annuum]
MAYASVASLMRTMGLVLAPKSLLKSLISDHEEELLALHEKVSFLEVFLKKFEKDNTSEKMTDLEAQIKELATVFEQIIQQRITEIIYANDEVQRERMHERLWDSLEQVAEEFDRIQKELTKFQDKGKQAPKEFLVQDASSVKHTPYVENNMVGRDDQMKRMLTELTRYGGSSGELKVIPIVGMGGIGKTTLAKEVYNDESIRLHFNVHYWATVSQKHNVKEILLSLLRCAKGEHFYMDDEAELADILQKSLKGKRYLIVLDDMWYSEAWDAVRLCFPSENNGSRILLTTRNTEVACSAGTGSLSLQMDLMGTDESWNLFESIAFSNEVLPSEFKIIGKQVVDKCHGLPLSIAVVAGLLKSKRTIEYWENVAKDVKSITNDPDKKCLDVLGLSYSHLTSDIKACLLYFGIFPEDEEISVKRLVRLWIAEGFLKLENDLEGEAEKCLQELVDRCLVLVSKRSLDETKIRSCKVHDLIHDLCLRELTQSQDVFVLNDILPYKMCSVGAQSSNPLPLEYCRLSRHEIQPLKQRTSYRSGNYRVLLNPGFHHHLIRGQTTDDDNNLLKRTRSIFSVFPFYLEFPFEPELFHFGSLRVLDLTDVTFYTFPSKILHLFWLRHLSMSGYFRVPRQISILRNLQTFISKLGYTPEFPQEIWELLELRHLKTKSIDLPKPPSLLVNEERFFIFSNIHTISGMKPHCCTEEVMLGISNVKKLGICGSPYEYGRFQESRLVNNLFHLHQLETLSFEVEVLSPYENSSLSIPSAKAFPVTLKKLKLIDTDLSWEDLNIIGELPNLEVLKLKYGACRGDEWHPIEGGFAGLKVLQLYESELKYWKATNDNFPILERLIITSCSELDELPIEFAEINSLRLIELKWCDPKLEDSAARIQQEQEYLGNKPVDIHIIISFALLPFFFYCSILDSELMKDEVMLSQTDYLRRSSGCRLQLAYMKSESLVIADQP